MNTYGKIFLKPRGLGRQHEADRQTAEVLKAGGSVIVVDRHIERFERRMLRDFDLLLIWNQPAAHPIWPD